MAQGKFRHELKYPIGFWEYLAIRSRLRPVMQPDTHGLPDGKYLIRSIYFDNPNDKALKDKINGVQKREKWRIRYYNDDLSYLAMEKKCKLNNLCQKFSVAITEEQGRSILSGETEGLLEQGAGLLKEFYCKSKAQQLKAKVLVSYLREAYVFAPGNVRVTFDSQLRTSLFHQGFLSCAVPDICAGVQPKNIIMEVKFDGFLPEVIADLLQTDGIRQHAFSKYCACRCFG